MKKIKVIRKETSARGVTVTLVDRSDLGKPLMAIGVKFISHRTGEIDEEATIFPYNDKGAQEAFDILMRLSRRRTGRNMISFVQKTLRG